MSIATRQPRASQCHELAPGVRRLTAPNPSAMTGPGTNTYIIGTNEVVVIDPGVDDAAHLQAIVAHAPGPVREILLTHKHPDHSGGARTLAAMTGAPVRCEATPLQGVYDPDFVADGAIAHGEQISLDGQTLAAIHTPGHTPDHLCFLLRETGLLLAGDAVMADVTVVIIPPDGAMGAYFDTLETLKKLPIQAIAPGHGRVLAQPAAEIEHIVTHRLERETQLLSLLRQGAADVAELAARIYPHVPAELRGMAQAQLTAHLLKLEGERRVQHAAEQRWACSADKLQVSE